MGERIDRDVGSRVGELRQAARTYQDRYGEIEDLLPLDRLDQALAGRLARLEQLRQVAREVNAEIRAYETEITGIERGIEAMLGDVLPRIARRFDEAWSPTPVLGYRIWAMSDDGLYGVRTRWDKPRLSATCQTTDDTNEVPHSDGRCGRLGCGIYAAKSPDALLEEFAPALKSAFAAGLIALEGKVVEHEHGYRGAEATVLAIAAVENMQAEMTADPERLERLFAGDAPVTAGLAHPDRPSLFSAIVEFLKNEERKDDPWT